MPKVKIGDINMYYEVHGEGEPLVMINGLGSSTGVQYRAIHKFPDRYKLVIFDNRGAGKTDVPPPPYTMEMMANDLAGLLEAIGIDSAHIFGASMGGMIAQEFAIRYPEKVKSLILGCTYCGGPGSVLTSDPEVLEAMQVSESRPAEEMVRDTIRVCVSPKFFEDNPAEIEEIVEHLSLDPVTPQGMMGQMAAIMGHDTYDRLPEIKAPTLVIAGDADRLVQIENSQTIASRIPGAELAILEGMGHMFMFEAEEASNRIVEDFLRRHTSNK